jgi:transketolase
MTKEERAALEDLAREIRIKAITSIAHLGVGHVGGAMSVAEALAVLYGKRLRHDPANPAWPGRDRLVMSKGHAGPALYAALAVRGFFPEDWLLTLNKGGTRLPSHCDRTKTPGIDMTTGSLGQGLSAAAGMALGLRMDGGSQTVYCIVGDGELDEGQNWEAAMFAAHQRLDGLVALMDDNKLQIDGLTKDILSLGDVVAKWRAFGWEVERVDGHDVEALDAAIARALGRRGSGKPSMIVMDTVKGKGCPCFENQAASHNTTVSAEQLAESLVALGASGALGASAALGAAPGKAPAAS